MKKKILSVFAIFSILASLFAAPISCGPLELSWDYPGGNLKFRGFKDGVAEIAPDLRDTNFPWFYWNFEAVATKTGKVKFAFPVGASRLSAQGPAVSTDGGKSWKWLGKAKTHFKKGAKDSDSFEWEFKKAGEKVRFAQGIPYQRSDFEAFYSEYAASSYMKRGVLTKTRKGVDVPMVVIGNGPKNVLITARHHSCEAIASYVVEGFMREALSESPAGKEFRDKYTLYVIPFVDLDGVEAGDQGKNRAPHDHNRDYGLGEKALYPEVKAIINLDKEKKFFVVMDMHAPAVRGDIHEAIYFAGHKSPSNAANSHEFKAWLDEERPNATGRIKVLGKPKAAKVSGDTGIPCGHYFSVYGTQVAYSATFEFAYANSNYNYNDKALLKYGEGMCRAFVRLDISKSAEPRKGYAEFAAFTKKLSAGLSKDVVKKATDAIDKGGLAGHYLMAAHLARAGAYYKSKKYNEALADNEVVLNSPYATQAQRNKAAFGALQSFINNPKTKGETVDKWREKLLSEGYHLYEVYECLYAYYSSAKRDDDAVAMAKMQLPLATQFNTGRVRNRIMRYELKYGDKAKAIEFARATVAYLKPKIYPVVPRGVFGPDMVIDCVTAMALLPETTVEEIEKIAELGLNHKICYDYKRKNLKKLVDDFKDERALKK